MSDVKRFGLVEADGVAPIHIEQLTDGEFVAFDDYEKLESENAELREQLGNANERTNEATKIANENGGALIEAKRENAELRERAEAGMRLAKAHEAVSGLMSDSHGVSGLHLNGDVAPWASLLAGGEFEDWLKDFSAVTPEDITKVRGEG